MLIARQAFVVSLALAAGCLGPHYEVSPDELRRLARVPPKDRGNRVRAVQNFGFESEPPPADSGPPMAEPELVGLGVSAHVAARIHNPPPRYRRRPRRTAGIRPGRRGTRDDVPREEVEGEDSRGGDGDGDVDAAAAIAFIVAGAALGVGLAATEGARFDGWLTLPEEQPLHLFGPNGEQVWIPLWGLEPEVADWAEYGVVSEAEGPILRLERAPLDRVGFVFAFEAGVGWLNRPAAGTSNDSTVGFLGRVALGGFPLPELGFLFGVGTGIGDSAVEWRPHVEIQWLPLRAGRLHGGPWLSAGAALGQGSGPENDDFAVLDTGAGVVGQLELTTRLALTLRAGVHVFPGPGDLDVLPEVTLGVAVY